MVNHLIILIQRMNLIFELTSQIYNIGKTNNLENEIASFFVTLKIILPCNYTLLAKLRIILNFDVRFNCY